MQFAQFVLLGVDMVRLSMLYFDCASCVVCTTEQVVLARLRKRCFHEVVYSISACGFVFVFDLVLFWAATVE